MKIAAIYNVWDGCDLIKGSIDCIKDHVDKIIIVWQDVSNIGEHFDPMPWLTFDFETNKKIIHSKYEPNFGISASQNEVRKRNIGLEIANNGTHCTHFVHIDVDEYYKDFAAAKKEFLISGCRGSVCRIYTYFKKPTWRLENLDGYYVPFIHELTEDCRAGNSSYPYYCDPTRTINYNDGNHLRRDEIAEIAEPMHHFSWIRDDIGRKARNSSTVSYGNGYKGLLADYAAVTEENVEGYVIKDMGCQKLKIVKNLFGIVRS